MIHIIRKLRKLLRKDSTWGQRCGSLGRMFASKAEIAEFADCVEFFSYII